ncbi:MAG: hypothetical protein Q9193_005281 [Seirophora villosa]
MVVQLSLLIYTHELSSLTGALVRASERRTKDTAEYVAPPRYEALKGTLRAIREQTCGFMWELTISAVEKKLYSSLASMDGSLYTIRTIPQNVLQALLDAFTAIQHLPEHTRLQISSATGLPTIVVWAHHILGLSVKVHVDGESHVFGDELATVYLDGDHRGPPKVALLNETDDPFFQLLKKREDPVLVPVCRHPIRDYGTRVYRLRNEDRETERTLVYLIVTSCMTVAQYPDKNGRDLPEEPNPFPTVQRVLSVSRLLFSSNEDVIDGIDVRSTLVCVEKVRNVDRLLTLEIKNDQNLQQLLLAYKKLVMKLIHITFVLCMVQGVEDDLSLYIDVLPEPQYTHFDRDSSADMTFKVPDAEKAFFSLSLLLLGPVERHSLDDSSVDPSDAGTSFAFMRGVPARNGERKHYIVDGAWSLRKEALAYDYAKHSRLDISHRPGDQCILSSWTRVKDRRYYIGVKDDAFEVANILDYDDPAVNAKDRGCADHDSSFSCGFRSMQEVCWRVHHGPPCQHPATPGQSSFVLPENVFAFRGVGRPQLEIFKPDAVLAALVAGDSSARWILMATMVYAWRASWSKQGVAPPQEQIVCLRSRGLLLRVRREVRAALQTGALRFGLVH